MGARLRMAGIDSFTIYEQAATLGGTWRDNTYPGLTCDLPSRFYQFRFAPNPDWTGRYSNGAEISRYLDSVAEQFGLDDHVRTGCEVTAARFLDERPGHPENHEFRHDGSAACDVGQEVRRDVERSV